MRPGGWRCPSLPGTGADFLLIQALSPHASRVATSLGTGRVGHTLDLTPNTVLTLPTGLPLPALCTWLPSCPHKPVSARASLMLRIVFGCPNGSSAYPSLCPSVLPSPPLSAQSLHPSIYLAPSSNPCTLPSLLIQSVYVFLPFSLAPGIHSRESFPCIS